MWAVGLDADAWCRMLTCYRKSSDHLCTALAAFGRCLCTEDLDSHHLSAFTAARLIPLDKKPGVRPIAVGEVFRRIVCRAIMKVVERDVLRATTPFQLCIGVPSAWGAGVHAIQELYAQDNTQGILFVDASNAFNSLNRKAALNNILHVCPALATVFRNTCGQPIRLLVSGGGEVLSTEGTCQGDPLAMALYAVATVPLIRSLQDSNPSVVQAWYADDDSAGGTVQSLLSYWEDVCSFGPSYGYHPNPRKTILLVKPEYEQEAHRLFSPSGVTITTAGNRHLGGAVGSAAFCNEFMARRVQGWSRELVTLASMAVTQPQAAYTVFTKGYSSTWTYRLRCSQCPLELLGPVDTALDESLLPALLGEGVQSGSAERELLSLPVRFGGLAIPILSKSATAEFVESSTVTKPLVQLLLTGTYTTTPPASPGIVSSATVLPSTCPNPVFAAVCDVRQFARTAKLAKAQHT